MGQRAWQWIVRHQDEFFVVADERSQWKRLKFVAELGLIAGSLIDQMPEARALLERAWEGLERGDHIARVLHQRPVVAPAYLPFRMAGCRSPALEQILAEGSWLRDHARMAPFARFAIGVTLQSVGVALPWNEGEVILANRFFESPTRQTPPISAELLAHAIMWRSEMGRNREALDRHTVTLYRRVSVEWHRLLVEIGLLDPLGEMIIADLCAGDEPPPASVDMLCAGQREDGAMPSRRGDPATAFDDLYHTTCVAALAGTLSASARPAQIDSNRKDSPDSASRG